MKTHYYLDWFYDKGFSEKLANELQGDITDRKSLVMISADLPDDNDKQIRAEDVYEKAWFDQASIIFDKYHYIDHHTKQEDALPVIHNASVIFLCGGNPQYQKSLLEENKLVDIIKKVMLL